MTIPLTTLIADQPGGDLIGLLGFDRARDRARQHDAVIDPLGRGHCLAGTSA
jgi:hypothetical protein